MKGNKYYIDQNVIVVLNRKVLKVRIASVQSVKDGLGYTVKRLNAVKEKNPFPPSDKDVLELLADLALEKTIIPETEIFVSEEDFRQNVKITE